MSRIQMTDVLFDREASGGNQLFKVGRTIPGGTGLTVTIREWADPIDDLAGANATHYTAATGGSSSTSAFTADAATGAWSTWVDPGRYDVTYSGTGITTVTKRLEMVDAGRTAVTQEAPLNARWPEFGALGDGSTDDSDALTAAVATAKTAPNGRLYIPRGDYLYGDGLDLDDLVEGITIEGDGMRGGTRLQYTGAAGSAISARASYGVTIRGLKLEYSNPAFAGDLIKNGWSEEVRDASEFLLEDCYVGGIDSSCRGARSLVLLNQTICSTLRRCTLTNAQNGVWGQDVDDDPTYHHSVTMALDQVMFPQTIVEAQIRNGGEAWGMRGCTFEPLVNGKAGAFLQDAGVDAYDLKFEGCWGGDVTTNGGNWIDTRGANVLGLQLLGGRWSSPGAGAGDSTLKLGAGQGLLVSARLEGHTGVDFTDDYWYGGALVGCDFQNTVPVANPANARGLVKLGNNGVPSGIDDYADFAVGASLDLASHLTFGSVFSEVQWPDAKLKRSGANVVAVENAMQLTAMSAGAALANTLFVDAADNLLKWKDNGSTLRVVTVV